MESSALEEKINKIKLQNEEIKRRYKEVEDDKKNAAKSNALVQLVPSTDWPERKEPPEFSTSHRNNSKTKFVNIDYYDHQQYYPPNDGKKIHKFSQGDGPPPDPKYNFLADSEREIQVRGDSKDVENVRSRNKSHKITTKRSNKEVYSREHRFLHDDSRDGDILEYDAWRAERNRIDEARINRQKTAEGNWRREWDSNKANIDNSSRKNESNRKEAKDHDRRNYYDGDSIRGNHRSFHGSQRSYNNQDHRREPSYIQSNARQSMREHLLFNGDDEVPVTDETTTDFNQAHLKGQLMSVKVNSLNIAGTGRVGPRQKSRVTYSSQSEANMTSQVSDTFTRQKSFDEKSMRNYSSNYKTAKTAHRKKEVGTKTFHIKKSEFKKDDSSLSFKRHGEKQTIPDAMAAKSLRILKRNEKSSPHDLAKFTRSAVNNENINDNVFESVTSNDNDNYCEAKNSEISDIDEYDCKYLEQKSFQDSKMDDKPCDGESLDEIKLSNTKEEENDVLRSELINEPIDSFSVESSFDNSNREMEDVNFIKNNPTCHEDNNMSETANKESQDKCIESADKIEDLNDKCTVEKEDFIEDKCKSDAIETVVQESVNNELDVSKSDVEYKSSPETDCKNTNNVDDVSEFQINEEHKNKEVEMDNIGNISTEISKEQTAQIDNLVKNDDESNLKSSEVVENSSSGLLIKPTEEIGVSAPEHSTIFTSEDVTKETTKLNVQSCDKFVENELKQIEKVEESEHISNDEKLEISDKP